MTSSCFLCGHQIRRQLGFNPAGLDTGTCDILKALRKSWTTSLCSLLDVTDMERQKVLRNSPFCLDCHEMISSVEFMKTTVARLEQKIFQVKIEVNSLLRKGYHKSKSGSKRRQTLEQVLTMDQLLAQDPPPYQFEPGGVSDLNRTNKDCTAECIKFKLENARSSIDDAVMGEPYVAHYEDDDSSSTPEPNKLSLRETDTITKPAPMPKPKRKRTPVPVSKSEQGHRLQPKSTSTRSKTGYVCDSCHEVVLGRRALVRHMKDSHPPVVPETIHKLGCEFCGKLYLTEEEVKDHQVLHDPKSPESNPFSCVFCQAEFLSTFDLKRHVRADHEELNDNEPQFLCDLCPTSCSTKNKLRYHKLRHHHHGIKTMLRCPQCPYQAIFPSVLKAHMKTHGERDYKCDVENCTKAFLEMKTLKTHKRNVHGLGAASTFPCSLCDKVYFTSVRLKQHEMYHSSLRPYMCEVCSSTFKSIRNLRSHRKVHEENKQNGTNLKLQRPRKARLQDLRLVKVKKSEEESAQGSFDIIDIEIDDPENQTLICIPLQISRCSE